MTAVKTPANQDRYYPLDMLKFVASVLIVFHHFQQVFDIKYNGINFFGGDIYFGYVVELFFMLSGLFAAMHSIKHSEESFESYMLHKCERIFPMVWITVSVHALTLTAYKFFTGEEMSSLGIWKYIKSMTLIFDCGIIDSKENGFNNPIWYLGVLLICYAVFWLVNQDAVINKLGKIPSYIFMVLLGLSVISYDINVPFINSDVARGVIPFFVGCLLLNLYKSQKNRRLSAVSLIVLIITVAAYIISDNTFYDNLQMILVFAIYPSLIILMMSSSIMHTIFNRALFGELGKISFEMYMWHVPVFSVIKLMAAMKLIPIPETFASMLFVTAIVIVLSTAMYYCIERKINQFLASRKPL